MSTAMDLRISADSDIKRLREMVQKLEEKNAGLKIGDCSLEPTTNIDDNEAMRTVSPSRRVAVKLNLEDVPLLDLSEVESEEEDSWLYMSPVHPPTPAQKSVSPYKYLKRSIDGSNLSKVRGSLMAKLESIAAQEEALSRHDYHDTPQRDRRSWSGSNENQSRPRMDSFEDDMEELPLEHNSDTYPIRRRGTAKGGSPRQPSSQYKAWEDLSVVDNYDDDDNDLDFNEAPIIRRRGTKPVTPRGQSTKFQDATDFGPVVQRGSLAHNFSVEMPNEEYDEEDMESAPVVRRRGTRSLTPTSRSAARMLDDDIPVVSQVRPRGKPSQNFAVNVPDDDIPVVSQIRPRGRPSQNFSVNVPDDDDCDGAIDAPVRRRGVRQSLPGARTNQSPPQMVCQGEEEDMESVQVRPRRRAPPPQSNSFEGDDIGDMGFDNQAPVVRRRVPPAAKPSDDSLVVTAVRRRTPASDGQVRPRGSGLPSPQHGGLPAPTRRGTPPRVRVSEDTEVRRRSLPQVPSVRASLPPPSSYSDHTIQPRGSGPNTPPMARVRSTSPAGRLGTKADLPVVPRGSKLAAPRRIPVPASTYYNGEDTWQEGCY